jgi:hypothetical protein
MNRMIGTALFVAVMGTGVMASVTVTPLDDSKPAGTSGTAALGSAATQSATGNAAPAAASQPADATLNLDYANGLMDAGKWKETLQLLAKLYTMPGFDRPKLQIMRGECLLQMKETQSAISALQDASRDADAAHNTVEANDAAAFAFLIQKSEPKMLYTPINSPEKSPIDVMDKTKRKAAYQALLLDEMVVLQSMIREASTKGTLKGFMDVARDVPALKGIERNANGGTKQSDQFAKDAANSASKVITTALAEMDQQISQISVVADHLIANPGGSTYTPTSSTPQIAGMQTSNTTGSYRHQGLDGGSAQRLRNIMDTCAKIPNAVQQLSKAFENPEPFFHLTTRAQTTYNRAQQVLNKDYNQP